MDLCLWRIMFFILEIFDFIFSCSKVCIRPIQNFVTNATRIAAGTKPSIYKESNFTNTYKANGKFPTMPNPTWNPTLFSNIHHSRVYDKNWRFTMNKSHRSDIYSFNMFNKDVSAKCYILELNMMYVEFYVRVGLLLINEKRVSKTGTRFSECRSQLWRKLTPRRRRTWKIFDEVFPINALRYALIFL